MLDDVKESKQTESEGKPLNEIMRNIFKRVEDENERTVMGYSRMHHRHSRYNGPER